MDLPRMRWEQIVECPSCRAIGTVLRRDWPEQGSDLWQTECGSCRYIWRMERR